jgi:hypothetical protein
MLSPPKFTYSGGGAEMTRAPKENAGSSHADAQPGRRSRRQAIALAGAAAAAATVAALGMERPKGAHATPGEPLMLGLVFNDSGMEATGLTAAVKGPSPQGPVFQPDFTLGVTNTAPTPGPDETAKALSARSYGEGVAGTTAGDGPHSFGVFGASVIPGPPGEPDLGWGPAPGVAGASGSGPGVIGDSETGPGVAGSSQTGPGVEGRSQSFGVSGHGQIGVMGRSGEPPPADGGKGGMPSAGVLGEAWAEGSAGVMAFSGQGPLLALKVVGKAQFSTAGAGAVRARMNAATVANPAVTADSHITVTFTSDPGSASVAWVERKPGTGFIVHLSSGPHRKASFTYLIVEPGV